MLFIIPAAFVVYNYFAGLMISSKFEFKFEFNALNSEKFGIRIFKFFRISNALVAIGRKKEGNKNPYGIPIRSFKPFSFL